MIGKFLIALGAAALTAGTASANIVTFTWTGTFAGGTDDMGLFGKAGADLTGVAFTDVMKFDPTAGRIQGDSTYLNTLGGVGLDQPSPARLNKITVNGHTYVGDGAQYAILNTMVYSDDSPESYLLTFSGQYGQDFYWETWFEISSTENRGYGDVNFTGFDGDVSQDSLWNAYFYAFPASGNGEFLNLVPTHLTIQNDAVSPVGGVPEPASWAMMVGGFGFVGGMLRGHRRRAALALR
jgi:hypothetical protein